MYLNINSTSILSVFSKCMIICDAVVTKIAPPVVSAVPVLSFAVMVARRLAVFPIVVPGLIGLLIVLLGADTMKQINR